MPRRISLSSTRACRFLISSIAIAYLVGPLSDAAFQTHSEQLLRLDGELHRQVEEHLLAEAVDDHVDRVFRRQTALLAVENLVLADLRRGCLMLHLGRAVL